MSFMGGGDPPEAPPFNPIDIKKIATKALDQDLRRYFSYQFPVFPGMSDIRQAEIEDAYKQLTGPLSPEFQRQFMRTATVQTQGVTGGGNLYSGMGLQEGSMAKGAQSASFTRQQMAKEDYDRSRLESLVQQNPVPGVGLTQQDLLGLYVYNTGAANASAMANYANQIAGANSAFANQQATFGAIGNMISGLGQTYYNYNYANNFYNPGGIPFSGSGSTGG